MKNFFRRHLALVVILIALLIAGTNYLVYPLFIKKELNIISVPVAITTINEGTQINETMIKYIEVVDNYVPSNILMNKEDILNKYVKENSVIVTEGFFYNELISDAKGTMGKLFARLNEGEYAYNIVVDNQYSTNINFKINEYINVYVRFTTKELDGSTRDRFGQLLENKRIIGINEESNLITLALDEKELAFVSLAEELENVSIIPALYFDSAIGEHNTDYYDIDSLRDYIYTHTTIYKKQSGTIFEVEDNATE